MFENIPFFCMVMILSIIIRKTLYQIDSRLFKRILHVLDFVGVVVHELSHAVACILMGVPVKQIHFGWRSEKTRAVAPHGHVRTTTREANFLKQAVISLAPLIISTWLFFACLDLAFDVRLPDLLRIFCGIMCISLILGASPSSTDLGNIVSFFKQDVQYSLYQILLVFLSFLSIIAIMLVFSVMIFEFLYFLLIPIVYFAFKYFFLGMSKLFGNHYLRVKGKIVRSNLLRNAHRPLAPYKIGIEEAHW